MTGLLTVMGEITETGQLVVELPPDVPRGRVVVTVGPAPEDDLELTDEDVTGLGLTAEEIAASAEMGAWADESEIGDGASYVERLRRPILASWGFAQRIESPAPWSRPAPAS